MGRGPPQAAKGFFKSAAQQRTFHAQADIMRQNKTCLWYLLLII
jgi:hypothetical protein